MGKWIIWRTTGSFKQHSSPYRNFLLEEKNYKNGSSKEAAPISLKGTFSSEKCTVHDSKNKWFFQVTCIALQDQCGLEESTAIFMWASFLKLKGCFFQTKCVFFCMLLVFENKVGSTKDAALFYLKVLWSGSEQSFSFWHVLSRYFHWEISIERMMTLWEGSRQGPQAQRPVLSWSKNISVRCFLSRR